MRFGPPRFELALSVMLIVVTITGCNDRPPQASNTTHLQLNWIPDAQHGGFYAAQQILRDSTPPLPLEIRAGRPGTPVIPQLVMGKVDFAIANADQVLLARAQGADIVAVFAPLQTNPRCIMVHEETAAGSIAELHDITLAMGEGNAFAEFLKAEAKWKNVRIVAYSGSVARFLAEPNFAQQAYVFSEPLVVRERGGTARCLMVSDLGFNPYAGMLITRRELIESDPALVQRVVTAVYAGWKAYFESPQSVHATLQELNEEMTGPILQQSAEEIRELCLPGNMPVEQLGTMSAVRWQQLADQLTKLGLLQNASDASQAFTTQFLDSAERSEQP